ncbi:hypothetical protein F444_00864 [Phytophthora nicotianae P1976]|uniref:Uncharacterized protein n=1 Tax=Phytophthora nicotianae P1976 TaxID=1317066 RepID=A0A081B2T4_PHYNI|nr:hypothetical protein F444_00864 [Phytophthora nicotianae P1976]
MNKEAGDEGLPVETLALQTRSETGGAEELQTGNETDEVPTNSLEKLQIDGEVVGGGRWRELQTNSV